MYRSVAGRRVELERADAGEADFAKGFGRIAKGKCRSRCCGGGGQGLPDCDGAEGVSAGLCGAVDGVDEGTVGEAGEGEVAVDVLHSEHYQLNLPLCGILEIGMEIVRKALT